MNYEEMSDFEINKLVAEKYLKLFVDVAKSKGRLDSDAWLIDSEGLLRWINYNPCHDPSHAWPIILDNGISVNKWDKSDSFWTSDVEHPKTCDEYNTIEIKHENPLRAAMICFLKMKDAEK